MSNALDMVLVDDAGTAILSFPVTVEWHAELMNCAEELGGCTFLQRIRDYYQDAEYEPSEVSRLREEIQRLMEYVSSGNYRVQFMGDVSEFRGFLFVLHCLCIEAERKHLKCEAQAV